MKKLSLLTVLFAMIIAVSSCKKSEETSTPDNGGTPAKEITIEKKQFSMFIDFTATWCGPCGAWGIPTFQNALTTNGSNVVGFAVHAAPPQQSDLVGYYHKSTTNDTLFISPVLSDLLNGINGLSLTGWPTLWLNNAKMSSNAAAINSAITAKASLTPSAGVGMEISKKGNGFDVKVGTKFFEAGSGDYHLTVLITENDVQNRQYVNTAYNNSFVHQHITRGTAINSTNAARPATFGDAAIASGTIAADTYVEKSFSFTMPTFKNIPSTVNTWNWNPAKSEVVVILWKKNGAKYDFVNIAKKAI